MPNDMTTGHPPASGPVLAEIHWLALAVAQVLRIPVNVQALLSTFPPPHHDGTLAQAFALLKLQIKEVQFKKLRQPALPSIAVRVDTKQSSTASAEADVQQASFTPEIEPRYALVLSIDAERVLLARQGEPKPKAMTHADFAVQYQPKVFSVRKQHEELSDDAGQAAATTSFGFGWFIREMRKHKSVIRDVLLTSFALQLVGLATPLFTQAIIDKVIAHRTYSTLFAILIGMLIFTGFNSLMSWARQAAILRVGTRIDGVLGGQVFNHLLHLPARYFEHRATGILVARMHGVETIREFLTGAAVTLILDLPFVILFAAIMAWYSLPLTAIALTLVVLIATISFLVRPLFKKKLDQQFLVGARNQAFLTEYVSGIETVKCLQMEPQLRNRFEGYNGDYLQATQSMRQLANNYSAGIGSLEQLQNIAILIVGAHYAMTEPGFTIGMLVAFQMFSSRLSQPLMRLSGLWQEFQQANIAVKRLGDVMNVPTEPQSIKPSRQLGGPGALEWRNVSFRYGDDRPYLYRDFSFQVKPGQLVAICGPSGSGKSTLVKLLMGFYPATDGQVMVDGLDVRLLPANELRAYFGVVPQETVLFSGSVLENLQMADPYANFEDITFACKLAEIHSTIEALPEGYQTIVGEHGAGLSGGQKQRIAIARALLKKPRVLIFDEATSSLDVEAAEAFANTLNKLKEKATMLFIAHHLPKNLSSDLIMNVGKHEAKKKSM